MALSIRPMQWANLPELHQAPPLDESDLDCLEEIRAVLARHGKLARFALHLAHRHFDLAPGEILIERPDPDGRSQHVSVGRLDDESEARPTTWLFEEGPELRLSDAVYCICVSDPNKTDACIRHGKSRSRGAAHQRDEAAKQQRISEDKGRHERGFPAGGHNEPERERPAECASSSAMCKIGALEASKPSMSSSHQGLNLAVPPSTRFSKHEYFYD